MPCHKSLRGWAYLNVFSRRPIPRIKIHSLRRLQLVSTAYQCCGRGMVLHAWHVSARRVLSRWPHSSDVQDILLHLPHARTGGTTAWARLKPNVTAPRRNLRAPIRTNITPCHPPTCPGDNFVSSVRYWIILSIRWWCMRVRWGFLWECLWPTSSSKRACLTTLRRGISNDVIHYF